MTLLLGIDIGTFETKGVLVRADGTVVAQAKRRHGISTPRPGFVEQDPETNWWVDVCSIAQELCARPKAADGIASVAISAIGPCVVATDKWLTPLRPAILYGVDQRATHQIEAVNARLGVSAITARCGNALTSQSAGPKIAWIHDEEPSVWSAARWFMTSQSWVVAKLTGEVVMDHATTGYFHPLYNLSAGCWDIRGCEDFIDEGRLPRLGWTTDFAGRVTKEASVATGIPLGTPVIIGTTDSPAEAVGAGVVDEGTLMMQYGSAGYLIRVGAQPVGVAELWAAPFVFEGTSVLAAGTSTLGTLTRWLCGVLDVTGADDDDMFGALVALAGQSVPGAHGLLMLPHLIGERTPFQDAGSRGVMIGLGLEHTRADIARAALEGVGHALAEAAEVYRRHGVSIDRVIAIGGGTKNPFIVETVSAVTGLTQEIGETAGAAYGDAFLAALAAGLVPSRSAIADWQQSVRLVGPPASSGSYRRDHEDYLRLYQVTADLQHERASRLRMVG